MAALGRSGACFHPEKVDIVYGEHLVAGTAGGWARRPRPPG